MAAGQHGRRGRHLGRRGIQHCRHLDRDLGYGERNAELAEGLEGLAEEAERIGGLPLEGCQSGPDREPLGLVAGGVHA